MQEKRRYHRMNIVIPVLFSFSGAGSWVAATTMDVSATGLSLRLNDPVVVGQMLILRADLDGTKTVMVEAKVIWIKEKTSDIGKTYQAGLKIVDKMDQDEIAFVRFIAQKMFEYFVPRKGDSENTG